jgi:methionyl-tRNA formyltransferase
MYPSKLRLVWVGFHQEGVSALRSVLEAGLEVAGLITLREQSLRQRSGAGDYDAVLRGFDVPVFRVANINDPEALELLSRLQPDVLVVIGWSQILRAEALATARLGVVGAHASLLPHNRGSAPVNWALIRGESVTGNTLMWLNDSVDEGTVIDQVRFPITPYDTCASLYGKVASSNREMLLRLFERLACGERPGSPQPASVEPLLPRRRPEDGAIDWSRTARQVYDFVRALARPYPGAFSHLDDERWRIWRAAVLPTTRPFAAPGTILGPVFSPTEQACGQMVACGDGAVILLEVEAPDGAILTGSLLSEQPWSGRTWSQPTMATVKA